MKLFNQYFLNLPLCLFSRTLEFCKEGVNVGAFAFSGRIFMTKLAPSVLPLVTLDSDKN